MRSSEMCDQMDTYIYIYQNEEMHLVISISSVAKWIMESEWSIDMVMIVRWMDGWMDGWMASAKQSYLCLLIMLADNAPKTKDSAEPTRQSLVLILLYLDIV
jgi:hypothetical protein